jgi:hypothetical protein
LYLPCFVLLIRQAAGISCGGFSGDENNVGQLSETEADRK